MSKVCKLNTLEGYCTSLYKVTPHAILLSLAYNSRTLLFQIYSEISQDENLHKVKDTLETSHEDHFGKAIALAWKFVTLPNPLIVCQPKGFSNHTHSPEFGHWEKHAKECELIYTRPVIYRNYEGMLACKGWVANTATSDRKSKCVLS